MNPVDKAAYNLELAKRTEAMASAARVDAEKELIALLPIKDEGSVSMKGEAYKVSITYGFNRTVDVAALEAIKREVPPELFEQAIDYKPSLVLAGLRYLASNEPDVYAMLAQAITSKPSKPSVKIEQFANTKESRPDPTEHDYRMEEIQAISHQAIIAQSGRLGVRVGGTVECIREALAETEAWPITDEFGDLKGLAQMTKDNTVKRIKAMLDSAEPMREAA